MNFKSLAYLDLETKFSDNLVRIITLDGSHHYCHFKDPHFDHQLHSSSGHLNSITDLITSYSKIIINSLLKLSETPKENIILDYLEYIKGFQKDILEQVQQNKTTTFGRPETDFKQELINLVTAQRTITNQVREIFSTSQKTSEDLQNLLSLQEKLARRLKAIEEEIEEFKNI